MIAITNKTFEDCIEDESGTVYYSGASQGIEYLVVRGPASVNAYLGIPAKHPMAGMNYDDIPLRVHGGLTFGQFGRSGENWPSYWCQGFYWIGWDYAHLGDKCFYALDYPSTFNMHDKEWNPNMVFGEVKKAIPDLVKLLTKYRGIHGYIFRLKKAIHRMTS